MNVRRYTIALIDRVQDSSIDRDRLIQDLLNWMGEQDVKEFVQHTDYLDAGTSDT